MITQEPVIQRGIAVSCLLVMKVIQTRKPLLELFYLTPKVKKKKKVQGVHLYQVNCLWIKNSNSIPVDWLTDNQ